MLRVSNGRIKICFNPTSYDMGHVYGPDFDCADWFWMDLNSYIEKKDFEEIDYKNLNEAEVQYAKDLIVDPTKQIDMNDPMSSFQYPTLYKMNVAIKKSLGMVWQFNAVSSNFDGYVRSYVILGEKRLCRVSVFEAYILLPMYKIICKVLNKLNVAKLVDRFYK